MFTLFKWQFFVTNIRVRRHSSRIIVINGHYPSRSFVSRCLLINSLPRIRTSPSIISLVSTTTNMFYSGFYLFLVLIELLSINIKNKMVFIAYHNYCLLIQKIPFIIMMTTMMRRFRPRSGRRWPMWMS